jgi:hypothetical protein
MRTETLVVAMTGAGILGGIVGALLFLGSGAFKSCGITSQVAVGTTGVDGDVWKRVE